MDASAAKRVLQPMRRTGRQAEFDWLAVHLRGDVPALAVGRVLQLPHLRRFAEANELAVPFRRLDIMRQHQHAVAWADLARCSPSRAGSLPGCRAFPDAPAARSRPARPSACVNSLSRAISPVWFMPISTTQTARFGTGIAQCQRHAPEIVKTARAGIGGRICGKELLGAGLAGAAGQANHGTVEPRPRRARQRPQAIDQRVLDDQLRNADTIDPMRNDHRDRAGGFAPCRRIPSRRARWRSWK